MNYGYESVHVNYKPQGGIELIYFSDKADSNHTGYTLATQPNSRLIYKAKNIMKSGCN
jgi:hypothetical protein